MAQATSLLFIDSDLIRSAAELNEVLSTVSDRTICLTRQDIFDSLDKDKIESELREADIVHGGLKFEGATAFVDLQVLTFNWNFLVPDSSKDAYTWRATKEFICFDSRLFQKMNGFVSGLSVNASVMEFCYRAMMAGAKVKYLAYVVKQSQPYEPSVSKSDNLYFAYHHLGNKPYKFLRLFYLAGFQSAGMVVNIPPPVINESVPYQFRIKSSQKLRAVGDYTAIIPTIGRYDYIEKSIQSLLKYPFPPDEIIVVDQTPESNRQYSIYEPFIKQGILKVFYLDSSGQCASRNLAIEKAKNEWLLFFEDDTEAWPDMIKEHIELMEYSTADVSTGVSLAPWKDESYIPERIKRYHVSDVLATGNCFMKRDTALEVGGLHMAFNRGSGADDDFGRRLFLAGKLIIFNFKAIQTHYKAPTGGMRVHGAWWRNTSKLLGAYPPPTQAFMIRNYYPSKFWAIQFALFYLQAKKVNNLWSYFLILLFSPIKLLKSIRSSSALLKTTALN